MTAPAQRFVRELGRVLDRRQREAPGRVRERRVEGRETDGRHRLVSLDGTCVLSGQVGPEGTGDVVTLPTGPLYHRGTTGIATVSVSRETATLYVERLDPDEYSPGEMYTVEVHGRGFTETTEVDFLVPGSEEINEAILVTSRRYISDVLLEVDITLDADAPLYASAPIAYDDPAQVS